MSLCELISRAETDTLSEVDLEHPLLMDVLDEIAECEKEENSRLKQLFGDAKQLSDNILRPYFELSRTDRLAMAEVYQEEVFRKIGMVHGSKKKNYNKRLNGNLKLMSQISNYSKLIPLVEDYIESNKTLKVLNQTSFISYIIRTYPKGTTIPASDYTNPASIRKFSFRKGRSDRTTSTTFQDETKWGIPRALAKKMNEAETLVHAREKILDNYIKATKKIRLPSHLSIIYYLNHHSMIGEKTIHGTIDSLYNYREWDFRKSKRRPNQSNSEVIKSMTFGLPGYKERIEEIESALAQRKQILNNYLEATKSKLLPSKARLARYLDIHDIDGKEVKETSRNSLINFGRWDFRISKACKKLSQSEVVESMTFGLPGYKKKILDAESKLLQRKQILDNYIEKTHNTIYPSELSFINYMNRHSIDGEEVKNLSKESLVQYKLWDFRTSKYIRGQTQSEAIKSMTTGLPGYEQKVIEIESALPQRRQILENYIKNARQDSSLTHTLIHYLNYHNIDGELLSKRSKDSLANFRQWDFRTSKRNTNQSLTDVIDSMTFGLEEYREKLVAIESKISIRKRILDNYISRIGKTLMPSKMSLVNYMHTHDVDGKEVKSQSKESLRTFSYWNYKTLERNQNYSSRGLVESMTVGLPGYTNIIKEIESGLPQRKRILENYLAQKDKRTSLNRYMQTHDIEGVVSDRGDSLRAFLRFDFEDGRVHKKSSREHLLRSMTYMIPEELARRLHEVHP